MCSPAGHSFIALTIALAWLLPARQKLVDAIRWCWDHKILLLFCLFAGNAPDVDYIPGFLQGRMNDYHHILSHSMGWGLLCSFGLWLGWKAFDHTVRFRQLVLVLALVFSHLLVDLMTQDGEAPYGILFFWPFNSDFVQAPFWVFGMARKDDFAMMFQWYNVMVMLKELLVVLPFFIGVMVWKLKRVG
ncbi:MAG: membrane-bound metal-dependent hydrolase YbcI (DUF457 family) [Kiritimatiellia bacterium]|jgi:membrane-bound metal-dependent hydrolase YbcI (DUF457 family)